MAADKLIAAVNLIDNIAAGKKPEDAELVRKKLMKSPAAAFREAQNLGYSSSSNTKGATKSGKKKKEETPLAAPAPAAINTADNELLAIEDHAQAMKVINQIIEYMEDLAGSAVSEEHQREWQETMAALNDALSDAGILDP